MGNSCEPQRAECCAECCGPVLVLDEPTLERHEYGARPSSACNKTDEDIPLLLRHSPAGKSHTPAQPMAWDEQVVAFCPGLPFSASRAPGAGYSIYKRQACKPGPPSMARLTGTICAHIGLGAARHGVRALRAAQSA